MRVCCVNQSLSVCLLFVGVIACESHEDPLTNESTSNETNVVEANICSQKECRFYLEAESLGHLTCTPKKPNRPSAVPIIGIGKSTQVYVCDSPESYQEACRLASLESAQPALDACNENLEYLVRRYCKDAPRITRCQPPKAPQHCPDALIGFTPT